MPQTGIDHVLLCLGSRLKWVIHRLPRQLEGIFLAAGTDGEVAYGQRLDHIVRAVHGAHILQYGLIDRTSYSKFEMRIMAQFQIGEVLMGEQFQNHRGNSRQARLAVISVPQAAALPPDAEPGGDIPLQARQNHVCQIAGGITGDAGVQLTVIVIGGIDAQCTYQLVLFGKTRITVHS